MISHAAERRDRSAEVKTAGYEMSDVAAQLQKFYMRNGKRA